MMAEGFLPVSREDMEKQHIDQLDFVYVIGDAYVDHPSFGHAISSRVLAFQPNMYEACICVCMCMCMCVCVCVYVCVCMT